MDIIQSTNRTILFDEINPEKLDLLTLIGDVDRRESIDDDTVWKVNDHLLVKNFDEFIEKFAPVVYCFFNAANQRVTYTLKKPNPDIVPEDSLQTIPLDINNDIVKMCVSLVQTKGAVGTENVDFNFENVLSMLTPQKVMDDILAVRKEINYLFDEYNKFDDDDPNKLDYGDRLNAKMEEASQSYSNIMALLPLAIDDSRERLLAGGGGDGGECEKFVAGRLTLDSGGKLKIAEIPKNEKESDSTALIEVGEDSLPTALTLVDVFKEDYEYTARENQSDYALELVLRTFCPLSVSSNKEIDVAQEVEKFNGYVTFYQTMKSDLIKVIRPLLEKIIGVFTFFDQYKATKIKSMVPSLLISNCKLEMIVKANNMARLQLYLDTVNNKNDFRNTIWFGIVNGIEFSAGTGKKLSRERFKGNKKEDNNTETNAMGNLALLMQGIWEYRIQTFFSFETSNDTSFSKIAEGGVDAFMDKTDSLKGKDFSEYVISCLPNISVVPRNKSGVILDKLMQRIEKDGEVIGAKESKEKKDQLKIFLEGIYIPAAYVAAGLTAACQCPEFLKTKLVRNVSRNYPGVRFDIEAKDYAQRITTTLGKEITGYTNKIKDKINGQNYGFLFSSDNYHVNGREVKNITVYKARSMGMDDGEYLNVYQTLTSTYVERMIRAKTSDNKDGSVSLFFSSNPVSQKSEWLRNNNYENSIINPGDDMSLMGIDDGSGTGEISLVFSGRTKNLQIIIQKSSKA